MRIELDVLDHAILRVLQLDADITFDALSKLVHASPATCQRRVRRLKDNGVIEKVVAIVNTRAVDEALIAIAEVSLTSQTAQTLAAFELRANASALVQQCYRVATGPDFILILAVPNMAAYHDVASTLFTVSNDVRNVRTFFSVLRSKFSGAIPI